jgi:hypothetical protein
MTDYFSPDLHAFFSSSLHGSRTLSIIDPAWQRPTVEIPDPDWIAADHPEGTPHPLITVPDDSVAAPTIEVPNPDCKIPPDAVEITEAEHAALLEAQSMGKVIKPDADGRPVAVDPPPPTLDEVRAGKTAEINAACAASIVGGFTSLALGTLHTYDSALEDQLNLIGAVGLDVDLPYRCADAAGVKEFRPHTAAQLKQVAADGAAIKLAALEKAATLKAQVQAAADAAAVEAVAW